MRDSSPIDNVLAKLSGVTEHGSGLTAFCPSHDDQSPRLKISVGGAGNVILRCMDSCSEEKILEALNISNRDLYTAMYSEVDFEIFEIQEEIDKAGKVADASSGTRNQKNDTQSSKLMKLAEDVELFHDSDGESYATVSVNSHKETYRIKSKGFREWLAFQYWQSERSTASSQALQDAINGLSGRARFEGEVNSVNLRVAIKDEALCLDLGNDQWQTVKVTKVGWVVLNEPTAKFRRTRGTLPLPIPERGGSIEELRRFVNISDEDWPLLLSWLASVFRPNRPFPVLVLHGEQGSGKSTTAKVIRSLIDPNVSPLHSTPKDERDLMIAASNSWVISLDNLSSMSVSLSDSLCRLSTGGGFSTRELYSDGEETLLDIMRPVILNGIDEVISRSDLLDRAILLRLPRIKRRSDETTFWSEYEEAKPRILGALLNAVCSALSMIEDVTQKARTEQTDLPRLADFTLWGMAAESGFGLSPGQFVERYKGNRDAVHELVLDTDPFAGAVIKFMQYRNAWTGTSTELLAEINDITTLMISKMRSFPSDPRAVGRRLGLIAPNLRSHDIEYIPVDRAKKGRELTLRKLRSGDGENDEPGTV